MVNLPSPPMVTGKSVDELVSVRRYLFRLVDALNMSLNNLTEENFSPDAAQSIGGYTEEEKKELAQTQDELKSLIIKNAKTVTAEIEAITHELESNYVAVSDFGTLQENIRTEVTETAAGLESSITAVSQVVGQYISTTNGYIRQGVVGYEGLTPIIGIAIGQDIAVTGEKATVGGVEYETIDTSHNMSIWTTKKLSFYVNGAEVAYFANDALYVTGIHTGTVTFPNWVVDDGNGLSFRWTGGIT